MVILVDKQDNEIGRMEKLKAHEYGLLHRAFSVFIFNAKGEMLIQKRAASKYHSPNLWTNACCSHPKPDEDLQTACKRRLKEEIGIHCHLDLISIGHLLYKASFENGLTEHEYDHILSLDTEDTPVLNPDEASEFRYLSISAIKNEIALDPNSFTVWFKLIMEKDFFPKS